MIATLSTRQLALFDGVVDRRGQATRARRSARPFASRLNGASLPAPPEACPPARTHGPRGGRPEAPRSSERSTNRVRETSQRPTVPDAEQTRILNALRHNVSGMTDEELQALLEMPGNSERPRRRELERKGLIRDSGRRRAVRSGRQAIVWIACDETSTT